MNFMKKFIKEFFEVFHYPKW